MVHRAGPRAEKIGLDAQAALKTKADAEGYVRSDARKSPGALASSPTKRPSMPVTGKLDRDAYTIEKVIFESRPGLLVTANLYLPKGAKGPRPGVVGSCGHSHTGKAEPAYQSFCQGLARMGYVVLIFDPIGQGERLQYGHVEKPERPGVGVGEHLLAGNQQFLVGEFFGSWRAWDGIRASTICCRGRKWSRSVGITGAPRRRHDDDGCAASILAGRWGTRLLRHDLRRNMENELPADTEQCPPHCLAWDSITATSSPRWPEAGRDLARKRLLRRSRFGGSVSSP
ncbi:MAG: hypothetical protein U0792_23545 [Gemmataceae bacterium]